MLILQALFWAEAVPAQEVERPAVVAGMDHVPVAVGDLAAAAARYRALGFALKPGRPHANGIENVHVKFPDGTEIELISVPQARDALTRRYRRHLAEGDGPAFLALYAPDMPAAAWRLERLGRPYEGGAAMLTLPAEDALSYLFFGRRNASPTDRPVHFAHENTAEALLGVWLAGDDLSAERRLLEGLGAVVHREEVYVPERVSAPVARFAEGFVVLLPGRFQQMKGRRIAGVTLSVRSLRVARWAIGGSGIAATSPATGLSGRSLFLPPETTHGLWIELRERGNW